MFNIKTSIKTGILAAAGAAFLYGGQTALAENLTYIFEKAGIEAVRYASETRLLFDGAQEGKSITVTFRSQITPEEHYQKQYDISDETFFETPLREGWDFLGWCTKEDGTGEYHECALGLSEDTTLYAIWKEKPDGVLIEEKKLYVGEKYQLVLKKADGDLKWESDNTDVAKVNQDGIVRPIKKGKAVITVTQYGKSYQCKITVEVPKVKTAYGILLSQTKDHKNMSYLLNDMDGDGVDELIVVDQLPVSIQDKQNTGTASFVDTTEEKTKKNIRIYRYNKGEVVLMKKLTYKNMVNINKHKSSGKLMIMNLHDNRADYNFLSCTGGKVHVSTLSSYKGGSYPITSVTRATDKMIQKDFKYAPKKAKKN